MKMNNTNTTEQMREVARLTDVGNRMAKRNRNGDASSYFECAAKILSDMMCATTKTTKHTKRREAVTLCDALERWLRMSGSNVKIDRDWFPVEVSVEPLGHTGRDKVTVAFAVVARKDRPRWRR